MQTTRLVLTVPFMRYPAGTVFELEDVVDYSDWPEEEWMREKQSFTDKRVYALPDGGRGLACSLSASDTRPCPAEVFDNIDLRTGPCRITKVEAGAECGPLGENQVSLADLAGISAQGITIQLPEGYEKPRSIALLDLLHNAELQVFTDFRPGETLDFSHLLPGFYQLQIRYPNDCQHSIRFIKSFPLLVFFETGSYRYTTQKTLY